MKGCFFNDRITDSYVVDPMGWFASEKLDGIRAIWTGEALVSKQNRPIVAPQWFIDQLPTSLSLDGELILNNRNQLHQIQSVVMKKNPDHHQWKAIKYQIFDIPDSTKLIFEQVQVLLKARLPKIPFLQVIPQQRIKNLKHLLSLQKQLVSEGAEGIMIRKPHSSYEIGEVKHLLKFKSQIDSSTNQLVHLYDDEAIIIGYKYNFEVLREDGQPTIKSLIVKWVDQQKFPCAPEFCVSHQLTKADKRGNYQYLFPIDQKINILYTQLFPSQKPRYPRYGGRIE